MWPPCPRIWTLFPPLITSLECIYWHVQTNQPPKYRKKVNDIVSLTLTLGWKNKIQPYSPIELDLEAGNLVQNNFCFLLNSIHNGFWMLGLKLADKQSQLPASCKFHVQSLRSYTILFLLTPPQLELDSEAAPTCLTINFYDIALSV